MKQVVFVFVYACIFMGLSLAVLAQDEADARSVSELKTVYTEFDKATRELNTKAFEKYLSENYLLEAGEEILDKRQMIANLKGQFSLIKEITESVSVIEKIEIVQGSYILDVVTISVGKIKTSSGKIKGFAITSKSTDVWQKDRRGDWRQNTQIDRGSRIKIDHEEICLA